jgi:hypothetical protein
MCLITQYFITLFIALSYDHKITSQLLVQCLGIYCCWLIHHNADAFRCTLIVSIGNHAVELLRIYSGVLLQEICCRQLGIVGLSFTSIVCFCFVQTETSNEWHHTPPTVLFFGGNQKVIVFSMSVIVKKKEQVYIDASWSSVVFEMGGIMPNPY